MRLEKIKLCGFKSFVDPTTIPLRGNLMGVVGPNGCGKSNIIDAVRWVMGESSAKHLRGDLMADVIFNGSTSRKPVAMASVELMFDNSDGRAGGEYAKYNSISIKRQVRRDGQSIYLLNGGRCRRKDITDIFLGTGLGPRSYAIIEQGTISRLIEAKPEEIRVYVEEAAGISKYKERRHDTEIRMRHTRENLDRLDDLRDEVGKQLKHLQNQSRKAEKFVAFRKQKRRYEQELLAMRWRAHEGANREFGENITAIEGKLKAFADDESSVDNALEEAKQAHKNLQQAMNDVQADYYSLSSDISRIEQAIEHTQASQEDLAHELDRLQQEQEQCQTDLEQDKRNLESIREESSTIEKCRVDADSNQSNCIAKHAEALSRQQDWQQRWDGVSSESAEYRQQTQVQETRIQHLQQSDEMLEDRLHRLREELAAAPDSALNEQISGLDGEVLLLDQRQQEIARRVEQAGQHANEQRQRVKQCQSDLHLAQAALHTVDARIASLEVLQYHAMGADNSELSAWLEQTSLSTETRLAQYLEVESGWETAVETVLDHFLEAICIDDLARVFGKLDEIPEQQTLAVFETGVSTGEISSGKPETLLSKVKSPWNLRALLDGIFCASDIQEAGRRCGSLQPHEYIVTPDGSCIGAGRLLIRRSKDAKAGVLKREVELRNLKKQHAQIEEDCRRIELQLGAVEDGLIEAENSSDESQQRYREVSSEMSQKSAELSAIKASHQHAQNRSRQIQREIAEVEGVQRNNAGDAAQAAKLKDEAEIELAATEDRKHELIEKQKDILLAIEEADTALQTAREQLHQHQSRAESLKSSASLTENHLQRSTGQHQQLLQRIQDIKAKLNDSDSPLDQQKEQLEGLMEERAEFEQKLSQARRNVEDSESKMVGLSEKRAQFERAVESERVQLDQLRMEKQTAHVRCQTILEQLQEFNVQIGDVLDDLADDADEPSWQDTVAELDTKIQRLGSVNLTAIEEYEQQSERMQYLNQQCDDLNESLASLEQAMRKIDQECRARFKTTFDRINSHMQKNFPKLFGGGHAQLELDDQNLLETGITINARPPGKRNTSIHLLSGGEKALTAVALIFSIFELNPAPFCLLDEVDAPLDDANTVRFSQLVEEMADTVQFLFITHNKATMEIARHLTGVTMREPGVSHMVAVDLEEAVEFAAV